MPEPLEPDDVDFFVGGVTPDEQSRVEMFELIAELRRRPEHAAQLAKAAAILADAGIDSRCFGVENPRELLEQGRQRVANLSRGATNPPEGVEVECPEKVIGRPR